MGYQDSPNKFGSLKFRAIYTAISFLVLGFNQGEGNSFFLSLLMFSVPLLYDNMRFSPVEKSRQIIKSAFVTVLFCQIAVGISGMIGIVDCILIDELKVVVSNKYIAFQGISFPLVWLWGSIGIDVALTITDTIIARPQYSKAKVVEACA